MSQIDLFGGDGDVVLPTGGLQKMPDELDVEGAISGDTVKSVLLPTEDELIQPNYVIDLTAVEEIEPIQVNAIDALLEEDGEAGIYLYIKGGIQRVGMGNKDKLDRIIAIAVNHTFGDKCRVFRNYKIGSEPEIFKAKDITKLRLNI